MFEIFNPKYFCLGGAEDTSDELDLTEGALRSTASAGPSGQERDQSVDSTSIEDAKEGTPGFHLINLRRLTRLRSSSTLEKFDEEGTDRLKHPMHLRRACTDVVWLGCFFACTAALATLSFGVRMPHQAEHMAFLIPMHDSLNHTCGVGQVWDKPFAFICKQDSGELNFTDVICLKSCPLNSSTSNSCWTNASQSDVEMPSYVTRTAVPYLLGWCRPENNALYVSVLEYANKVWGKFSIGYGILMMWRLMVPFLIAAATGLLLSLGYVALLKDYAPTLSKIGIRLIVLVPWVWAGYLWYKHGQGALLPCVALVVVGVCIGCCAASRMHELDKAAACIKLSCTCVCQTPMLHFGPCVVLLFRVASGFGILCFIILAHTGIFVDFLERGLITFRCSAQKQDDCIYDLVLFVLWLAMFVWIQILFTASWEFAVAYLAAEWYVEGGVHEKTGKDGFRQCCKQCHVWWVLFRYHFGTMIKASIFIGAIRPFRAVLGSLTAVARLEGNPVGSILNCCCGCFVDIYEQYFEKFSVNAYIEVAVSAMNLDHAAFEASEVCERQKGTASSLNGTTFIFQLVGLTLVWWAGYFVMWMIVSGSCPGLRQYGDVYSPHYVGHQGFWSNAGGIIALTAAFPAMMVFDVVSDTILYCVMVDVMQNESKATSYWSSMPRGVLELLDLINSWTSIFSSGSSSGSSSSASSSSGE